MTKPPAALETGDAVVEMEGAATLGDMANDFGAIGAPLFVRVELPSTIAGELLGDNAFSCVCACLRSTVR